MKERLKQRGAGILMSITSLPSPYGIGTMGKAAYHFVDQLAKAGQSYWQVLPIGPTSLGDSPYQACSSFAGNPYFIDLDMLIEDGLLKKSDLKGYDFGNDEANVDYEKIWNYRFKVLRTAYENSKDMHDDAQDYFEKKNREWLDDYALFMAVKNHFDNHEWLMWDEDIRFRERKAMISYKKALSEEIGFWKFIQFEFYKQWDSLKKYANEKGISIIGDIPIYVALDSVDVWKNPDQFLLDEDRRPTLVAGCPPDAFSDEGQKWGNPIYDWKKMEEDDFSWWKKRIEGSAKLYDIIRIDHFIGVVRYYTIPVNDSAKHGKFEWGPGEKLTKAIDSAKGEAEIIAEDLGVVIPEVQQLIEKTGYPGMKILEFAFDQNPDNEHLPQNYTKNFVVYGGTHDNDTLKSYYKSIDKRSKQYAYNYVGAHTEDELLDNVLRLAYGSVANTVIWQMQDVLKLDGDARMNLPSTIGTNWKWRMKKGEFTNDMVKKLAMLSKLYGRKRDIPVRNASKTAEAKKTTKKKEKK